MTKVLLLSTEHKKLRFKIAEYFGAKVFSIYTVYGLTLQDGLDAIRILIDQGFDISATIFNRAQQG